MSLCILWMDQGRTKKFGKYNFTKNIIGVFSRKNRKSQLYLFFIYRETFFAFVVLKLLYLASIRIRNVQKNNFPSSDPKTKLWSARAKLRKRRVTSKLGASKGCKKWLENWQNSNRTTTKSELRSCNLEILTWYFRYNAVVLF